MIGAMIIDRLDAVILAGGTAERLGGASKADLLLGGTRLLDLVLGSICSLRAGGPGADVVVAPDTVPVPRGVLRTMEEPPGSGPLAGIDAGLRMLPPPVIAGPAPGDMVPGDLVVVCAVDSPGIGQWAALLLEALGSREGATGAVTLSGEPEPFRQFLQAIYRRPALETALSAAGGLLNRSVRGALAPMALVDVAVDADFCRDLDTPEDLEWWRERLA